MHEEWRDIVGYEGLYQVSNFGRVKSTERYIKSGNGYRLKRERILTQHLNSKGYPRVNLHNYYTQEQLFVHRLVAEAFLPKEDGKFVIDHIDGNPLNSNVENLRWCTSSENNRFARELGHVKYVPMAMEKRERLNKKISKPVIRSDGKKYQSIKAAAEDLGVTTTSIIRVVKHRRSNCKGFGFEYLSNNEYYGDQ